MKQFKKPSKRKIFKILNNVNEDTDLEAGIGVAEPMVQPNTASQSRDSLDIILQAIPEFRAFLDAIANCVGVNTTPTMVNDLPPVTESVRHKKPA